MLNFFVAGSDTTATALTWILVHLSRNPNVLSRLQEEIDTLNNNSFLPGETQLPYLQAVIFEALRMTPPTASKKK